jgi:hypothetical protein
MCIKDLISFYERELKDCSALEIKRKLKKLGFKQIGRGAFSTALAFGNKKYVVKVSDDWHLEVPKKKSKIEKYFIPYTFLSKDKQFGIQPRARTLPRSQVKRMSEKDENKFLTHFRAARLHRCYDIHPLNVGWYKGKWMLFDL